MGRNCTCVCANSIPLGVSKSISKYKFELAPYASPIMNVVASQARFGITATPGAGKGPRRAEQITLRVSGPSIQSAQLTFIADWLHWPRQQWNNNENKNTFWTTFWLGTGGQSGPGPLISVSICSNVADWLQTKLFVLMFWPAGKPVDEVRVADVGRQFGGHWP